MRRAMTVLCVVALAGFVANAALATNYNEICLDNLNNTSGSSTATTNGLLWINTGSGPVKLTQDVNIELLGIGSTSATPVQPTADCYQLSNGDLAKLLLGPAGDGSAYGDVTFMATPGLFLDCGPDSGTAYAVPGSSGIKPHCYFQLLAWTGNYSSYDAAKAAGQYVGKSTVFENIAGSVGTSELDNMPAVILTKVPEPSTLLLMATGLFGLLAYAWRKRS
jgi:hypothetical protein